MSMEIKNLNQVKLSKIITREDLHKITTADDYAAEIISRCDELWERTKAECEELRVQTIEEVTAQITEENEKILDEFNLKLEKFLTTLTTDMYNTISQILQQLGIEVTDPAQIYRLINHELAKSSGIKDVTISVNSVVLDKLRQEFAENGSKLQIEWNIDNKLTLDECICATNLWTLKLNLNTLIKQVLSQTQQS